MCVCVCVWLCRLLCRDDLQQQNLSCVRDDAMMFNQHSLVCVRVISQAGLPQRFYSCQAETEIVHVHVHVCKL